MSNKLNSILRQLENQHGVRINIKHDGPKLREAYNHWNNVKTKRLLEAPFNSYMNDKEYAKASLICEAIRTFLSEISPPRRQGKVVSKKAKKQMPESRLIRETEDGRIIKPEIAIGKNMWKDSGIKADGEDKTNDYHKDRNPKGDHNYDDYEYDELMNLADDLFLLEPETGSDDSGEFNITTAYTGKQSAEERYEIATGPDATDYADDRNPARISKVDQANPENQDVTDELRKKKDFYSKETKTGLPDELETGFEASYDEGNMKNGVLDNSFNQDPRKTKQRDIPSPTASKSKTPPTEKPKKETKPKEEVDVEEADSTETEKPKKAPFKKKEEKISEDRRLALKMINEMNRPRSHGKILEGAKNVIREQAKMKRKVTVEKVLNAYESAGRHLLKEYMGSMKDPVYHDATLTAIEMVGDRTLRPYIENAIISYDKNNWLYDYLIEKAKRKGYDGKLLRQFVMAAHNTVLNTDIDKFIPN